MIETSWLTRHERGVLQAALLAYRAGQANKATTAAKAEVRTSSQANRHVADDLLRQLAGR